MSPLSADDRKRQRQLANLRRGGTVVPGNANARQHGGYAEVAQERVESRVGELLGALAEDAPLRAADGGLPRHDTVQIHLLATTLCRLEDVERYLTAFGYLDAKGNVRPAAELAGRLRREAADYLDALGMTPRSRARLGLDLADAAGKAPDLARALAQGQDGGDGA